MITMCQTQFICSAGFYRCVAVQFFLNLIQHLLRLFRCWIRNLQLRFRSDKFDPVHHIDKLLSVTGLPAVIRKVARLQQYRLRS